MRKKSRRFKACASWSAWTLVGLFNTSSSSVMLSQVGPTPLHSLKTCLRRFLEDSKARWSYNDLTILQFPIACTLRNKFSWCLCLIVLSSQFWPDWPSKILWGLGVLNILSRLGLNFFFFRLDQRTGRHFLSSFPNLWRRGLLPATAFRQEKHVY